MKWTEIDMRTVCDEVRCGSRLHRTAKKYGIPPSTLRGRLDGHLPHLVAYQDAQRLSMVQEDELADWVLFQASIREAPTQ